MMYRQCRHNRRKASCTSQTLAGVFCYDYALSDARRNIITNSWTCVIMPASVNVLAENSKHNNSKGEDFFLPFFVFWSFPVAETTGFEPSNGFSVLPLCCYHWQIFYVFMSYICHFQIRREEAINIHIFIVGWLLHTIISQAHCSSNITCNF